MDESPSSELSDEETSEDEETSDAEFEALIRRRNALAKEIDRCLTVSLKDWMTDNWEMVWEMRETFPKPGSHRKVMVLGEPHTWDSYCERTFGVGRRWINQLLDDCKSLDEREKSKRSEAATQANATRKANAEAGQQTPGEAVSEPFAGRRRGRRRVGSLRGRRFPAGRRAG